MNDLSWLPRLALLPGQFGEATSDSPSGSAELPLRPDVLGGAATPPYPKGGQTTVRVQVIDWDHPANSDFQLASQFGVTGPLYTCRSDRGGFINRLPLAVSGEDHAELRMRWRRLRPRGGSRTRRDSSPAPLILL